MGGGEMFAWWIEVSMARRPPPAAPDDRILGDNVLFPHDLVMAGDGSWFAEQTAEEIVLRDPRTFEPGLRLELRFGTQFGWMAAAADGSWLLVTEWKPDVRRAVLRIVDARSGEDRVTRDVAHISAVGGAPDGSGAVVVEEYDRAVVLDPHTGASTEVQAPTNTVVAVLSPRSEVFAVVRVEPQSLRREVAQVDVVSGATTWIPELAGAVNLAFAPDGRLGAIVGGALVVWEAERGRASVLGGSRREDPRWDGLWFAPDGSAYTVGTDGALVGWTATGRPLGPYLAPGALRADTVGFFDGQVAIAASHNGIAAWDTDTGALLPLPSPIFADRLVFSSDGALLHTSKAGRHHEVYTVEDGVRRAVGGSLDCGALVADEARARQCARIYRRMSWWRPETEPHQVQPIGDRGFLVLRSTGYEVVGPHSFGGTLLGAFRAYAAPDGRFAVIESHLFPPVLVDLQTGRRTELGSGDVGGVTWAEDGSLLALRLRRAVSLRRPEAPGTEVLLQDADQIAISADGTQVATASERGIEVADARTGRVVQVLSHDGTWGPVTALAFTPDGAHLASAANGTVRIHVLRSSDDPGSVDR